MGANLSVAKIRSFVAVAELKSFKQAAEKLHLSASALSMHVRDLEEILEISLLYRTTRAVELTAYGAQFLVRAQQILANLDTIITDFRGKTDFSESHLTVACAPSVVNPVLIKSIERFHEECPGTTIRLLDIGLREITEALLRNDAHLGLGMPHEASSELEFEPFMEDPFIAAVPSDHALAGNASVQLSELLSYPFVCLSKNYTVRRMLEHAAAEAGADLSPTFEIRYLHSAWGMVRAGLAVTAIPVATLPLLNTEGITTLAISPKLSRTIYLIRRKGERPSSSVRKFLALLRDVREQLAVGNSSPFPSEGKKRVTRVLGSERVRVLRDSA